MKQSSVGGKPHLDTPTVSDEALSISSVRRVSPTHCRFVISPFQRLFKIIQFEQLCQRPMQEMLRHAQAVF
jgi:hypothetical protein